MLSGPLSLPCALPDPVAQPAAEAGRLARSCPAGAARAPRTRRRGPRCSGSPSCARRRPARAAPRSGAATRPPVGRVGHQLQRDRRALDGLPPAAGVGGPRRATTARTATVSSNSAWISATRMRARRPVRGRLQHQAADLARRPGRAWRAGRSSSHRDLRLAARRRARGRRAASATCRSPRRRRRRRATVGAVRVPAVVEPRGDVDLEASSRPRTHWTIRTSRWVSVAVVARPAA